MAERIAVSRHGQSNTREHGAQLRRATRGNGQTTPHRGKSTRKRGLAILASSFCLIAREQLGFRNLFFVSVANLHYSGAKGF
jgi:hypothetical protein